MFRLFTIIITVSCPRGFIWYGKANKCYSSQVFESVPGTVMIQVCKDLHPEATTVEPRNQAQMDVIVSIAGESLARYSLKK